MISYLLSWSWSVSCRVAQALQKQNQSNEDNTQSEFTPVKGEWADAVLAATKDLFFDFIGSPA